MLNENAPCFLIPKAVRFNYVEFLFFNFCRNLGFPLSGTNRSLYILK